MANQAIPGSTLRMIRLALLAGVVIFGLAILYLTSTDGFPATPELGGVLRLVFLPLGLGAVAAIAAVRSVQSRAEPDRRGTFCVVGWALGEGVALFGGVAWLIAGEMLLYLTGLGLILVAFLLLPIPEGS